VFALHALKLLQSNCPFNITALYRTIGRMNEVQLWFMHPADMHALNGW